VEISGASSAGTQRVMVKLTTMGGSSAAVPVSHGTTETAVISPENCRRGLLDRFRKTHEGRDLCSCLYHVLSSRLLILNIFGLFNICATNGS
jgi:hypothetical protein